MTSASSSLEAEWKARPPFFSIYIGAVAHRPGHLRQGKVALVGRTRDSFGRDFADPLARADIHLVTVTPITARSENLHVRGSNLRDGRRSLPPSLFPSRKSSPLSHSEGIAEISPLEGLTGTNARTQRKAFLLPQILKRDAGAAGRVRTRILDYGFIKSYMIDYIDY